MQIIHVNRIPAVQLYEEAGKLLEQIERCGTIPRHSVLPALSPRQSMVYARALARLRRRERAMIHVLFPAR